MDWNRLETTRWSFHVRSEAKSLTGGKSSRRGVSSRNSDLRLTAGRRYVTKPPIGNTLDKALWISWYDLSATMRDEHLAWVHEVYIPKLLQRTGVLWSAHYASAK